jgi:hypothetical protein
MRIGTDLKEVMKKLDSINDKLTELSARIARIEKTFGIEEPKPPVQKRPRSQAPDKKAYQESLPPW